MGGESRTDGPEDLSALEAFRLWLGSVSLKSWDTDFLCPTGASAESESASGEAVIVKEC